MINKLKSLLTSKNHSTNLITEFDKNNNREDYMTGDDSENECIPYDLDNIKQPRIFNVPDEHELPLRKLNDEYHSQPENCNSVTHYNKWKYISELFPETNVIGEEWDYVIIDALHSCITEIIDSKSDSEKTDE